MEQPPAEVRGSAALDATEPGAHDARREARVRYLALLACINSVSLGYQIGAVTVSNGLVKRHLDLSNRAYLVYGVDLVNDRVGDFDVSLVEDFLYAFAQNAGVDLHVERRYGKSPHHVVEAVFKGLARALRVAVERDPRVEGVPSVKGAL